MLNLVNLLDGDTVVCRLRVAGGGDDPTLARLRLSSLLNRASLQSNQVSPSAIVFIRQFRDPLPGVLRLDQAGGHLPAVWNQAVRDEIDRLTREAARPALGMVSVGANAVVFLDRAEFLACLAADWCGGLVASRWWWQSLLRQGDVSRIVKQLWIEKPEYVPAALQHLANRTSVVDFVGALNDAMVRDLTRRVARTFALHALIPVLELSLEEVLASPTSERAADLPLPVPSARREIESTQLPPRAPWRRWVPESEEVRLRPEQQRFLGIALMIQRQPARVRTLTFAREVELWEEQVVSSSSIPHKQTERTNRLPGTIRKSTDSSRTVLIPDAAPAGQPNSRVARVSSDAEAPATPQSVSVESLSAPEELGIGYVEREVKTSRSLRPEQLQNSPVQSDLEHPAASDFVSQVAPETISPESDVAAQPSNFAAQPSNEADFAANEDLFSTQPKQTEIETEFGGLFYLINLALYLELYGDFTRPLGPGLELSIWDFVALVGTELIGDRIQDDALWSLLAQLSGRSENEPPGADFEPPDEWRLAPQWLEAFAITKTCHWTTLDGRLRLLHPEGFLVLDVPLESNDPLAQLQREIKPYRNLLGREIGLKGSVGLSGSISENVALRIWLSRLMPYLRARLCRALGLDMKEELAPILCRHYGRVRATATYVDVFFYLAELPVEIRLAGLDRDPGWVPAAGRFISFHYD